MGSIKLTIGSTNITGYILVRVAEANTPSAQAAPQQSFAPPHPIRSVEFNNLNDVIHIVSVFESPDGVNPGQLFNTFSVDVKSGAITGERRFYTAGGPNAIDPVVNATSITDPYLQGKLVTGVFKEGFRYAIPSVEWSFAGTVITLLPSYWIQDAGLGDQEVVSVEISYATASSSGPGGMFPKGLISITANTTQDPTHFNTLIEANGSSDILQYIFMDFASIPDSTKFAFNTDRGTQRTFSLFLPATYFAIIGGKQRGVIHMGKGEQLTVVKYGNSLRILSWDGDHLDIGQMIMSAGTPPINSVAMIGTWVFKTQYIRLWEWYVNELQGGEAMFAPDNSVIATNDRATWQIGTLKIWIPDWRGLVPKGASGSRKFGNIEAGQVGEFGLTLTKGRGFINADPVTADINKFAYGSANPIPRTVQINPGSENRVTNGAVNFYTII